jgi:hypothetical protein
MCARCEALIAMSRCPARASASIWWTTERLAGDLEQRLGQRVGERAHAIAATRGEDHRRRAPHQNVYPVRAA